MNEEKDILSKTDSFKSPSYTIDPSLDKYKDMNLFPEKLEKANEVLKTAKFPPELEKKINRNR